MAGPEVIRSADCANSPKNAAAEELGLALSGAQPLLREALSDGVIWDRSGTSLSGVEAVASTAEAVTPPLRIRIEQVVTHGKSAAVSGRVWTAPGQALLFCHMIRYTSAAQRQVAQIVSFDHPVRD
ncbi:hypothetical protein ACRARG_14740 [Pseudooceanicola sp. C21-150M6]|uniref:hypothetical protein n=1 Tax=Pseudooceanicola sp. C21-150M6 TaxID=3434355 RepID=UPI003D7F3553